jgi:predicted nucleic acid-binding protein
VTIAFDSNVILYAEGLDDAARQRMALDLLEKIPPSTRVIPVQVLGEVFHVLVRKGKRTSYAARHAVDAWAATARLAPTSPSTFAAALDLATDHGLAIWDSLVVNAAAEAGCRILLSEDMQDGFVWRGMTIVDPFRADRHPLLASLLGQL